MTRLFAALQLPDELRLALGRLRAGIQGARWIDPQEIHLTLRFIGEVDGATADDVAMALGGVAAPAFPVTLSGVGQFGDGKPHTLWAGVAPCEPLKRLATKIDQALQRVGLPPEGRRYTPHVTLARMKDPPRARIVEFLAEHGLFRAAAFCADHFTLFSSHQGHGGAHYVAEAHFPLTGSNGLRGSSL